MKSIRQLLRDRNVNGSISLKINLYTSSDNTTRKWICPNKISKNQSKLTESLMEKLNFLTNQFDTILGISEVRSAQNYVETAENEFMDCRRKVQMVRNELLREQNKLRYIRSKLDRTPREDEQYLQLATEEHKALVTERKAKFDLEMLEHAERDKFSAFSASVRSAHEKERSRVERTKYWSIIASACGAIFGIFGSTLLNIKRMKQIRVTIEENNDAFIAKTFNELKTLFTSQILVDIPTKDLQDKDQRQFMEMLNENRKILATIEEKMKIHFTPESSLNVKENSNIYEAYQQLSMDVDDISWWSKVDLIATVTCTACIIIYMVYK